LAEVTITLRADGNALLDDLVSPQVEAELVASGELEQGELTQEEERPRLTVIRGGALGERGDEDGLKLEDNLGIAQGGQETFDDAQEILDDSEQGLEVLDESGSQDEMPTKTNEKRRSASLISRFHWLASVSEVQVTRRFYRSGESEFFINKVQCRLKDLKDLFRAVGLGARAYTIVAQGEVGRIVTAKPADRRMILEEAAGVVGFRDKIAEATRRLADTSQNILRLQDVIGELERQVGILKRQASRARARQEIKEELIEAERTLFLDIYSSLQEREDEVAQGQEIGREAEERVGERFADLAVAEGSSRQELETIELRIDELRSRLERMREESLRRERTLTERKAKGEELRKLIQSTTNEMLRLSERCAVIAERKAKSSAHITDLEQQDEELGGQVQQSDEDGGAEIDDVAAELEEARTELAATEQQLRQVRDEFIAKESVLQAIREQIAAASPSQQLARVFGAELAGESTETLRLLLDEMHAKHGGFQHREYLEPRDFIELYDESDAMVHFSSEESFGLTFAEALSRNLPLFEYDVGAVLQIADGIAECRIFGVDDFGGLIDSLRTWILADHHGKTRDATPNSLIASRYHPSVIAEKHLEVYRLVIPGNRKQ
jgi:hypothetical protein